MTGYTFVWGKGPVILALDMMIGLTTIAIMP